MSPKTTFYSIAALAALTTGVWAQQGSSTRKGRPKIGLALEGGGALGLAHVGLLEWLEKNHVPVDYIAGASMGGLVAGFYATGMTPDEMHHLLDTLDFNQIVSPATANRAESFRRKEDARKLGDETVIGLRHGLIVPAGLNSGQQIDFLLSRIAAPYDPMRSFDDLPTPFRCMATDLVTTQAHVFEKGSLAEALRATMSIPGLFEPVLDGNKEYVDGGLLNNLPVDLVKSMGADIVIAVYLATDPLDPAKPQTLVDVLSRSLSAVISAQERHNIEAADLLVTINLSGLTKSDFSQYPEMIRRGYASSEKKSRVLTTFALNDAQWSEYLDRRKAKRKAAAPAPQFIEVTGVEGRTREAIRGYFAANIGRPFDDDAVRSQIERATGGDAFDYITYDLIERGGKPGLLIHVHPDPSKPPTLRPAVVLDSSDYRNSRVALAGRLIFTDFGGFRAELRNEFIAGSSYGFSSEYYRPFRPLTNWFVAPRAFAWTQPLDFYRRSRILSMYRERNAGGAIDLGYETGNKGEIRFGYEASRMATNSRLGDDTLIPVVSGRYGAARLSYGFDNVDDEVVPHGGMRGRATLRWVDSNAGASHGFPVLDGNATYFRPVTATSTSFAGVTGGSLFNRTNSGVPMFYLGGPQRLSAYGLNEVYGDEFVLARVGYLKQLAVISTLTNNKAYLLVDYEAGRMFGFQQATRAPMDVNAGLLVKTLLGPLFVGGSVGDAGHRKWYFEIGPVF